LDVCVTLIFPIKSGSGWAPVAASDYATPLQGTGLPVGYRLKNLSNILQPIIEKHAAGDANESTTWLNATTAIHALGDQPYFEVGDVRQSLDDAWLAEVINTNAELVSSHRVFVQGIDPETLDAYPAQELVKARNGDEPYDWRARWTECGGPKCNGRMIALKSHPVWLRLSDFGHPHPPFAFDSGMDVIDISRVQAVELALTGWRTDVQVPPCPICDA
jgi:hypothetical protein